MKLGEKVAYLKGLIEGLEIDGSTKEGKVILAIADILDEVAVTSEDMQDQIDEIVEVVDAIDEDLGEVERDFYDVDDCCCDDDDDYCECDDDGCECGCVLLVAPLRFRGRPGNRIKRVRREAQNENGRTGSRSERTAGRGSRRAGERAKVH